MTRENFVATLKEMGYVATVVDGGAKGRGVRMMLTPDGPVGAVVYKDFWHNINTEEIAEKVEAILATMPNATDVTSKTTDIEYFKQNAKIILKKRGHFTRQTLVRPFNDMDMGIGVRIALSDEQGNIMCSNPMLETLGLSADEAFDIAKQNTLNEFHYIKSMRKVLSELTGADLFDESPDTMYILSNEENTNGAAGLIDVDLISEFCDSHDVDGCWIIPSSVHEIILVLEDNEDSTKESLKNMIGDVNHSQVRPEEQLSDHPYWFDAELKELI